jgi:hypothetical protein
MCKQSCCPGGTHSSSGLAAAIFIGIVILAAVAEPAAHAALAVLHAAITIAILTAATLAGLAVTAAVVLVIRHARRAQQHALPGTSRRAAPGHHRPAIAAPTRAAVPAARPAPLALTAQQRACCQQIGADPEQIAEIVIAVLRGQP